MRIVIDTNVVVSRFSSPAGVPARIFAYWQAEAFEWLVSEAILAEYQRALTCKHVRTRHLLDDEAIAQLVDMFRRLAVLVEPEENFQAIVDDDDDNKYLAAAEAGGAEYIVSGDEHLLKLREHKGIRILSPAVFLALLNQGE